MGKLTSDQIFREINNGSSDASSISSLTLTHRALSDVTCLSNFHNLNRLDLSFNCLSSLEGLSGCVNLKWLSVIENKLESLKGVENLSNLTVLNAGKNKLKKMEEIRSATNLRAVILNDNQISSICKLDRLSNLNTLVLSRNPIIDIRDALVNTKSITKLSLSHCQIQEISSSLVSCLDLKELRLAHNNITSVPPELAHNMKIELIDLGNNFIESSSDLKVFASMPNLRNLNLHANPISERDNFVKKVKNLLPNLRILNAKPIEQVHSTRERKSREISPEIDSPKESKEKKKLKKSKLNLQDPETDDFIESKSETKGAKSMDVKREGIDASESKSEKKSRKISPEIDVPKETKRIKKSKLDLKDPETDNFIKSKSEKRREKSKDKKREGIDDTETSFVDLIFSGGENINIKEEEKVKRNSEIGGLVVDHTKKRKNNEKNRGKNVISASSVFKLLSPPPEIGSGGPSTWDN